MLHTSTKHKDYIEMSAQMWTVASELQILDNLFLRPCEVRLHLHSDQDVMSRVSHRHVVEFCDSKIFFQFEFCYVQNAHDPILYRNLRGTAGCMDHLLNDSRNELLMSQQSPR